MRPTLLFLVLFTAGSLSGCASDQSLQKAEKDGELLRFDLARTFVRKGAYVAALPLVQKAAAEHPDNPDVRTLHGTVLRERSLYPQAEREYLAALERAPNFAEAWAGLGILYDLMGRHEDALKAHRKSLELSPREASYWNNLGFSYYIAGEDDKAIDALQRALGLDASLVVAYNNLGFAYAKKQDFVNARRCFHAALGEVSGNLNLALAYEQSGDLATASQLRSEAKRHLTDGEERP
jgi:Flp pilus assembly protein TadD